LIDTMVPVVTSPIPVLDPIAQLVGKVLGCKDAGIFWTVGRSWSYLDRWSWDYTLQGQQVRSYEFRLGGLELSYSR
jgi:hypothetical protein